MTAPSLQADGHPELARVGSEPLVRGRIRDTPEDFQVDERLDLPDPEGGDHVWLRVRKRGANTQWVARSLARFAGVRPGDVGYAGLKDRHAVTTQWFSVNLSGRDEPDWSTLDAEGVDVLEISRRRRKLKRGQLRGNRFRLRIRGLEGDRSALEARLARVAAEGVPNYFGEQRFGRGGSNLAEARAMLAGRRVRDRDRRAMYLSAARSLVFNRVLSARVEAGTWNTPVPGDLLVLHGTRSRLPADVPWPEVQSRVASQDLHPAGPLWGRGAPLATGEALAAEREALAGCEDWCEGLERAGLEVGHRPFRLLPEDFGWVHESAGVMVLEFSLPPGAYATTVLRELVQAPC